MSLRHALLGLLAQQPASGYDLAKVFEGDFGRYAWHAGHTQIYPELNRMAADGLVAVASETARNRRVYAITDHGLAELRDWLRHPPDRTKMRNEHVLRTFLLPALGPREMRAALLEHADTAARKAKEVQAIADRLDRDAEQGQPVPFGRFAAEFGIRMNEAMRDWAQWVVERLD